MSDFEVWEEEGGLVEEETFDEPAEDTGSTLVKVNPRQRVGVVNDPESELRFTKDTETSVPNSEVDRLLELTRRGLPLLVRADS